MSLCFNHRGTHGLLISYPLPFDGRDLFSFGTYLLEPKMEGKVKFVSK